MKMCGLLSHGLVVAAQENTNASAKKPVGAKSTKIELYISHTYISQNGLHSNNTPDRSRRTLRAL
jgi:hypothetical protein